MGEIRIVGPGKTRGYPYLVCKKRRVYAISPGFIVQVGMSVCVCICEQFNLC